MKKFQPGVGARAQTRRVKETRIAVADRNNSGRTGASRTKISKVVNKKKKKKKEWK